jgi:hypothetical protein
MSAYLDGYMYKQAEDKRKAPWGSPPKPRSFMEGWRNATPAVPHPPEPTEIDYGTHDDTMAARARARQRRIPQKRLEQVKKIRPSLTALRPEFDNLSREAIERFLVEDPWDIDRSRLDRHRKGLALRRKAIENPNVPTETLRKNLGK